MTARYVLLIGCCVALTGCINKPSAERSVDRSLYYWKSVVDFSNADKAALSALHIQTIYLRCFDVDWDDVTNKPIPKATVRFTDTATLRSAPLKIIPAVFITMACLQNVPDSSINSLARQVVDFVDRIFSANQLPVYDELQIDCDWTATTKDKYFKLLSQIKNISGKTISATIRLHQVKFITKSGIPPADRGMLMCYNMGNLKNPATANSIIDGDELEKYTGDLSSYPLPLDVAFPIFDWYVLFRNNVYKGIIDQFPSQQLTGDWVAKNNDRYHVTKDTSVAGYDFKKGDWLRYEKSEYNTILQSAKSIRKKLNGTALKVSFFHLDSITLSKYTYDELENIYQCLH